MLKIKDSVTIVTGSSSGIGAATVRALAEHGGHVVINYSKSAAAAEQVAPSPWMVRACSCHPWP